MQWLSKSRASIFLSSV